MSLSDRDKVLLKKMLAEISDIEMFVAGMDCGSFLREKMAQKAVIMTLINMGELAKNLSADFVGETQHVPWHKIRGLRNIAAHRYDVVKMENIWFTIEQDIPFLKALLSARLSMPVEDDSEE